MNKQTTTTNKRPNTHLTLCFSCGKIIKNNGFKCKQNKKHCNEANEQWKHHSKVEQCVVFGWLLSLMFYSVARALNHLQSIVASANDDYFDRFGFTSFNAAHQHLFKWLWKCIELKRFRKIQNVICLNFELATVWSLARLRSLSLYIETAVALQC